LPACWIAGPYRHCRPRRRAVGRARAGTAGIRSPTAPCISGARRPVEPALSCARIAGPSQCGGSPAPRGCADLGDTEPSAASQSSRLGTTVESVWMLSQPSWRPARAGLIGARSSTILARAGSRVCATAVELLINRPVACSPLNRPVACSPLNRPLACSPSAGGAGAGPFPGHLRLGCYRPGGRQSRDSGRRT
jgi:hypothetical protein